MPYRPLWLGLAALLLLVPALPAAAQLVTDQSLAVTPGVCGMSEFIVGLGGNPIQFSCASAKKVLGPDAAGCVVYAGKKGQAVVTVQGSSQSWFLAQSVCPGGPAYKFWLVENADLGG